MQAITHIPQAPHFMECVTNLRGKVLPVIDLRKRFGLQDRQTDKNSRIIIVSNNGSQVGIIVDGVSEVQTISDQAVEQTPHITTTMDSSFITGIAKIDNRLVIMLEMSHILSTSEQAALAGMEK
jgi:purine-binding chemotaxis protein CheW